MAKTYKISNGSTVEITYCPMTGKYMAHNFRRNSIYGCGSYDTEEEAVSNIKRLAGIWGGYTVTEA